MLGEHNSVRMSSHASHGLVSQELTLRFESGKGPLVPPTYQPVWMQTSYPNTKSIAQGLLFESIPQGEFTEPTFLQGQIFCFFAFWISFLGAAPLWVRYKSISLLICICVDVCTTARADD